MTRKKEMVLDRLMDRLDAKERTIMRLTRKLGKANWRLKQPRKPVEGVDYEPFQVPPRPKQMEANAPLPKAGWAPGTAPEGCTEAGAVEEVETGAVLRKAVRPVTQERFDEVKRERDDALERHKQAHDRAMALHVVIDQAVHELREAPRDCSGDARAIDEAIHLLTRDDLEGGAKSEVEILRANAANWEAEAHERTRNLTNLENRMDEAAKLVDAIERVPPEWKKAVLALLVRGEGADVTQAEAWEKMARALNDRINQAVEALRSLAKEPHERANEALSLLTTDCAGGEA